MPIAPEKPPRLRVDVRWMIRRDLPPVLRIEGESSDPWTEEHFLTAQRQHNCIGMVAEHGADVVGYMVYLFRKSRLEIINFAVAPGYRRQGVGGQMIAKLVSKLSHQRRTRITLRVRETNLPAQLFFRDVGFRAVRLERGYYGEGGEDAIAMAYRLPPGEEGGEGA